MKVQDVTDTLNLALAASGCDQVRVVHKPRLLSDNGSSYVSADLAQWLDAQNIGHVRGAPYHPQTQGKIERWHQTLKNRILLENYYLPGDLEASIGRFVDHYNHQRRSGCRQRSRHCRDQEGSELHINSGHVAISECGV
jgi:putative transposase